MDCYFTLQLDDVPQLVDKCINILVVYCENKGIDSAVRRPAVYYIGRKVYA